MTSNNQIFTEDFFNTAYVITDAKPVSELTYLTMVETPPANADSFAELSVIPRKRAVELETLSVEVQGYSEIHNPYIDVSATSASVALNDLKQTVSKKLMGIYQTCGNETRENTLTKKQKFFRKIFKNLEFPVFVEHEFDTPESLRKIIAKLLLYSNLVAIKSRRGPANFIVVNGALGSLLQDNPSFVFTELNQAITTTMPALPYAIGMLGGFKVFVDPYKRFDDFSFLIGRRTSKQDPGVYLIEGDTSFDEIRVVNGDMKTVLKKRMALVKTDESANAAFYSNKFVFDKKPLWRKLFKL